MTAKWLLQPSLGMGSTFWAAGAAWDTPAKGFPATAGVSEMPAKGLLPALPAAAGAPSGTGADCPARRALKIFLFLSCLSSARAKPSPGSCTGTKESQQSLAALLEDHCCTPHGPLIKALIRQQFDQRKALA